MKLFTAINLTTPVIRLRKDQNLVSRLGVEGVGSAGELFMNRKSRFFDVPTPSTQRVLLRKKRNN